MMHALQSLFGQINQALELALRHFDAHIATIATMTAAALLFTLSLILLAARTGRLAERVETLVKAVDGLKRLEEARLYRELAHSAHRTKEQGGNGYAGKGQRQTDHAIKADGLV